MKEASSSPTSSRILRWTWALAVCLLFHVALFWGVYWTQEPKQKLRRPTRQFTEIQYFDAQAAERSEALYQQMTLFDPRPLLLPTEWNVSNVRRLGDFTQEEQDLFPEFGPMFELEEGNYLDDFGNVAAYYEELSMAQADFDYQLFDELGRESRSVEFVQEPGVDVVVTDPASGVERASATIYNKAAEQLSEQWPDWQPATLLATIENSFLVGGLTVVRSSGYVEADNRLRALAGDVMPGLGRLGDGVYLVEIVP